MAGTFTTRFVTPEEALRLTEDAFAIKQAIRLLQTVDHYNVAETPVKGRRMLHSSIGMLKQCQRFAERKLLVEYLVRPMHKKVLNGTQRRVV